MAIIPHKVIKNKKLILYQKLKKCCKKIKRAYFYQKPQKIESKLEKEKFIILNEKTKIKRLFYIKS